MGGEDGCAAAADAQFGVDRPDVAFDGVHRHGQVGPDFVEGEHGREQPEHGEFVPVLTAGAGGERPLREGFAVPKLPS